MADVLIQITAEEQDALDALKSVDQAMLTVKETAEATTEVTRNVIPTNEIEASAGSFHSVSRPLGLLRMGLSAAGVQSRALGVGMRAATISTTVFRGGVTGLAASLKGLLVTLGPVGWAILAVTAAVAGLLYLWNRHQKALEDQKKALEAFNETMRITGSELEDFEIRMLELADKTLAASIKSIEKQGREYRDALTEKETAERDAVENVEGNEAKSAEIRDRYGALRLASHRVQAREIEKLQSDHNKKLQELRDQGAERAEQQFQAVDSLMRDLDRNRLLSEAESIRKREELEEEFRTTDLERAAMKAAGVSRPEELEPHVRESIQADHLRRMAALKEKWDDKAKTDRENVQEAITRELESERERVTAHYDKLIEVAKEHGINTIALEKKKAKDLAAVDEAAEKERADAARDIRREEIEDTIEALQEQQEALRETRPAFKAQFVGLEEMGRRIQEAAASIAEPEEVAEIQKRIEALQKQQRDLAKESRDIQRETRDLLKKEREAQPAEAG